MPEDLKEIIASPKASPLTTYTEPIVVSSFKPDSGLSKQGAKYKNKKDKPKRDVKKETPKPDSEVVQSSTAAVGCFSAGSTSKPFKFNFSAKEFSPDVPTSSALQNQQYQHSFNYSGIEGNHYGGISQNCVAKIRRESVLSRSIAR